MKLAFLVALVVSFVGDNLSLPAGVETKREDLVTRCIVEVLSKALSKPNATPVDPECRDILKSAGPKYAAAEKRSDEEAAHPEGTQSQGFGEEEEVKRHEGDPGVRDGGKEEAENTEELLKAEEEKKSDKRHHGDSTEEEEEEEVSKRSHHSGRSGDSSEEEKRSQLDAREQDERDRPGHVEDKRHHPADIFEEAFKRHGVEEEEEEEEPEQRHHPSEKRHEEQEEQERPRDVDGKPRHDEEDEEEEDEREAAMRYLLAKRRSGAEGRLLSEEEEEALEKRSPWEYRGYYHPAWWKRGQETEEEEEERRQVGRNWWSERQAHRPPEKRPYPAGKVDQLAKFLSYKKAGFPMLSEPEEKRALHQRPLTPEEVT
ncbi:hypothetical protein AAFF_G00211980 [Aldrovandia affinis]|uniref:Secretogranin-1 n=1 Tax=Aldrovandia affinis TaxID=143900 RepID=A0AAD7RJR2_9TELE|nr:hypothetical protein AAFF_G00211980 [Aldrovandia affinis]